MSIRLIAKEIYRLHQAAEKLSQQIEQAPLLERTRLEAQLRKIKTEEKQMRRALAGALDQK